MCSGGAAPIVGTNRSGEPMEQAMTTVVPRPARPVARPATLRPRPLRAAVVVLFAVMAALLVAAALVSVLGPVPDGTGRLPRPAPAPAVGPRR